MTHYSDYRKSAAFADGQYNSQNNGTRGHAFYQSNLSGANKINNNNELKHEISGEQVPVIMSDHNGGGSQRNRFGYQQQIDDYDYEE